jgi:hypothetical protein
MNSRDYFIQCFKAEKPRFLRVFQAVPPGQLAYKPHPRSRSAGDLVWLLAAELHDACELVDRGDVEYKDVPAPATLAEAIAAYERNAADFEKKLPRLDDASWAKNASSSWTETWRGRRRWRHAWGFLFDAIHPGQLSAYLADGGEGPVHLRALGRRRDERAS